MTAPAGNSSATSGLTSAVVLLFVALAFGRLLVQDFDWVNLDDITGIKENPHFRGLSSSHLEWMFTTPLMGHYQPLTWMSLGLDYSLWGMNPTGYHRTNLFLHLANSTLAYVLFCRLLTHAFSTSQNALRHAAALGALLFAVHPLRVESVAWVTERRDLLSGLFYLLTLITYLWWLEKREAWWRYILCLVVFVLSMLSKAWGVTFAFVILLLNVYPLRRFSSQHWKRVLIEASPFLLIAIRFVFLASWAQSEAGAMKSLDEHGVVERVAQAAYGLCFYVVRTVWPFDLYPMYEIEEHFDAFSLLHVSGFLAVAAVSAALIVFYRRVPWLTVSWFAYACIVAPVLGFAQSGPQKVADRYTYLSCLPFALLAAAGAFFLMRRSGLKAPTRRALPLVSVALLLLLGTLTFGQCGVWRNSVSLWEHSVAINARSHISVFNLAKAYEDQGRYEDSIRQLRRALELRPHAVEPRRNLGILLAERKQQYDEAITQFKEILLHRPGDSEAHYCIGLCHAGRNRHREALQSYGEALRLSPSYALVHRALGDTYLKLGDRTRAMEHYRLAEIGGAAR